MDTFILTPKKDEFLEKVIEAEMTNAATRAINMLHEDPAAYESKK